MRRDVFQAIADPTRRRIIGLLAREPRNLNSIAERFEVSRPAISKQIRILAECGLIRIREQGRERVCEAKLDSLHKVSDWVAQYREFWEQKLDALEIYLDKLQGEKRKNQKKESPKKKINNSFSNTSKR